MTRPLLWLASLALIIAATLAATIFARRHRYDARHPVTFSTDIAPILYQHCTTCHQPGESAPFPLLTYDDAHRRAKQLAKVTAEHVMPPWMPDAGCATFLNERHLPDDQIQPFQRWLAHGAPQGDPAAAPPPPPPGSPWEHGVPDLIVKLDPPYTLPADGKDIYRNFVLPMPLEQRRYVRAVEFHPGNRRVMHHAFLLMDTTGVSRRRSGADGVSGYDGMSTGPDVSSPAGQMLSWQPGKRRCIASDRFPWSLSPGTDLVVQIHMRPTGKPESVAPEVGLYFTDHPAPITPVKLLLAAAKIDIPPGERDFTIDRTYTLPVDVDLLAVLPHAHYLGHRIDATAKLPDGSGKCLIRMHDWDFNWQSDYEYATPIPLPKGATLRFRIAFDNSADNPRNPHSPPRRVTYGTNSDDEMAELWMQVIPHSPADTSALVNDYLRNVGTPLMLERTQMQVALHPDDAGFRAELAVALLKTGHREGLTELNAALRLDPKNAPARRAYASLLFDKQDWPHAVEQYRLAIQSDPSDYRSLSDLGLALASQNQLPQAIEQFRAALQISPNDSLARANLARVLAMQGNRDQALREITDDERRNPDDPFVKQVASELRK
jgi:tetratricopeptide (TPR) repeat protein